MPSTVRNRFQTLSEKGFTLLEVLISLVILAIALSALVQTTGKNSANLSHLMNKSFAHWVAMNKMTELQISSSWPAAGTQTGRYDMANREWAWKIKTTETEDIYVRKVEISVADNQTPDDYIASLTAFLGAPEIRTSGQQP